MTEFSESGLKFKFGDAWRIFQLDAANPQSAHRDYREGIAKIQNTKAVDFVGIYHNTLHFIEVKNFKHHTIENKGRIQSSELAIEIAQKVRDSISCIIAVSRTSSDPNFWLPYKTLLCDPNKILKIIVWLEQDGLDSGSFQKRQHQKSTATIDRNYFKPKLRWLTTKISVENQSNFDLQDVTVENLSDLPT